MTRKIIPFLLVIFFFFAMGSVAEAKKCNFKKGAIPASLQAWSNKHYRDHPPTTRYRAKDVLSKKKTTEVLYYAWRAFGYSKDKAKKNSRLNTKQATIESSRRPNARQSVCDTNGCPGDKRTAGGLFQLIPKVFKKWELPGFSNRFAPLDNALATVNAQVNADYIHKAGKAKEKIKVLAGQGGWVAKGGKNPCR